MSKKYSYFSFYAKDVIVLYFLLIKSFLNTKFLLNNKVYLEAATGIYINLNILNLYEINNTIKNLAYYCYLCCFSFFFNYKYLMLLYFIACYWS